MPVGGNLENSSAVVAHGVFYASKFLQYIYSVYSDTLTLVLLNPGMPCHCKQCIDADQLSVGF